MKRRVWDVFATAKQVVQEPTQIVEFPPTAGFKPYHMFFVQESVKHPAKANLHMIRWIIEKYTKAGDWILDPMAGTYSTCIMAALLGRNSIGVEYEQKFYEMGLKNKERFESLETLNPKGKIVVLKGDARQLSKVLAENVDSILFSPPYAEALSPRRHKIVSGNGIGKRDPALAGTGEYSGCKEDNIGNLKYGEVDSIVFSPPYAERDSAFHDQNFKKYKTGRLSEISGMGEERYSKDKDNIGNMPYGEVDSVIFSPPYSGRDSAFHDQDFEKYKTGRLSEISGMAEERYSEDKSNIGNLPHGDIDAIVTSPPYAHGSTASKGDKYCGHGKEEPYTEDEYMSWKTRKGGNIGKKKLFKRVPCPKEEADRHDTRPERKGTPWEWTKTVKVETEDIGKEFEKEDRAETYLSAMLQVYSECFKVLRAGGLLIVVVKNFIRKKQIVRLDMDTIKICQHAGFTFVDRWYRKLTNFSFWVINYYKKYGLRVEYEDILVFRKESDSEGKVDSVVFSPPYSTKISSGDPEKRRERLKSAGYDPNKYMGGSARNLELKDYSGEY